MACSGFSTNTLLISAHSSVSVSNKNLKVWRIQMSLCSQGLILQPSPLPSLSVLERDEPEIACGGLGSLRRLPAWDQIPLPSSKMRTLVHRSRITDPSEWEAISGEAQHPQDCPQLKKLNFMKEHSTEGSTCYKEDSAGFESLCSRPWGVRLSEPSSPEWLQEGLPGRGRGWGWGEAQQPPLPLSRLSNSRPLADPIK